MEKRDNLPSTHTLIMNFEQLKVFKGCVRYIFACLFLKGYLRYKTILCHKVTLDV